LASALGHSFQGLPQGQQTTRIVELERYLLGECVLETNRGDNKSVLPTRRGILIAEAGAAPAGHGDSHTVPGGP